MINMMLRRVVFQGINRAAAYISRRTAPKGGSETKGGSHGKATKKLGKTAARSLRLGGRFMR
ncbi:hypothetical protein AADZ90_016690 [Aestuariibius sp. 2305UL40-4]|uniref:hypothetical protein n=1 Tax=Aestuariibius violaceus TaxID=3234132 RepID=UPI00345EC0BD